MTTLVLKLMATDEAPFSKEKRDAEFKLIKTALSEMVHGRGTFQHVQIIANALNYVHCFNSHGLIGEDIEETHGAAAKALAEVTKKFPYTITWDQYEKIQVVMGYWSDILEAATENLVRSIQHEVETTSEAAQARRSVERLRGSRRSHRKPKKKAKK